MADRKEEGRWQDGKWVTTSVGAATSAGDVANAQAAEKYGSTAGKNLGAKEKDSTGQPKQNPGEDVGAYSARLREWRAGQTQQKALKASPAPKTP